LAEQSDSQLNILGVDFISVLDAGTDFGIFTDFSHDVFCIALEHFYCSSLNGQVPYSHFREKKKLLIFIFNGLIPFIFLDDIYKNSFATEIFSIKNGFLLLVLIKINYF
jgi:hypothetical protein